MRTYVWPQMTGLYMGQETTEAILRQQLFDRFNVAVELGAELVDFEQSTDCVIARLRKATNRGEKPVEERITIQYLVGADGGKSAVRKKLGLSFLGEQREIVQIYGDAVIRGLDGKVRTNLSYLLKKRLTTSLVLAHVGRWPPSIVRRSL
jgi:2-polyprenyl-6-methoxyphenol hydroxylase-like FAD-dependent oxidoreductase